MRLFNSFVISTLQVTLLAGLASAAMFASASDGYIDGRAVLGGAIGGGAGAAVGSAVGGRNGAIIGSAVGAATGVAIATPQVRETHIVHEYWGEHEHHDHGRHLGHYKHHHHDDD